MTEMAGERDPVVTVLMSVRNGERHLRDAIESVLAQSFPDFEFIIVDDASSDTSRDIVAEYTDPRIRPTANERPLGLTRSLNRGIELARGRFIARMDADDVSAVDRLARQVEFLEANSEYAVVATYARTIDENSAPIGVARTPIMADEIRRHLRLQNCITHGSVMMRSDILRRFGGYDERMERAQDYDLWLRISEDHAIGTLPDYLYSWRDHAEGVSRTHLAEQERFAALAKRESRTRHVRALLEAVEDGSLGVGGAVHQICERMRAEDEFRTAAKSPAGFTERLSRRFPRLRALRYRLNHRERYREVRAVARAVHGHQRTAADAGTAIVVLISSEP